VVALVAVVMAHTNAWINALPLGSWTSSAGALWLHVGGLIAPFFALLIFVMALGQGLVSRLLSFPLLVLLGEISYSVYLIHSILLRVYAEHFRTFSWYQAWQAYLVYWLVLLLAAYVSWRCIERPCRAFLVGLWPQRPHPEAISRRWKFLGYERTRNPEQVSALGDD
jgi:peptidoglycan/LPS O-acetylase OafA/YrhL